MSLSRNVTGREFQRHGPATENSCLRDAFVFFLWHTSRHQPIAVILGRCRSRADNLQPGTIPRYCSEALVGASLSCGCAAVESLVWFAEHHAENAISAHIIGTPCKHRVGPTGSGGDDKYSTNKTRRRNVGDRRRQDGHCSGAEQRGRVVSLLPTESRTNMLCDAASDTDRLPRRLHRPPTNFLRRGTIRYDTIRYGRLTCAQKLTGWPA